jgi:hypothetical protein
MSPTVRRVLLVLGGIAFCLLAFRLAFTRSFEFGVAEYVRGFLHGLPAPFVTAVLSHLPVNEDPAAWIVRKAASVVFFAVVGALARALAGRRIGKASSRASLVIAAATAMSAALEIYEWPEPIGEVAFDLVCGVVGGVIAALILRLFRRL